VKTHALIVIPDGFEEIEFCCPFDILVRGGINVLVAGYNGTELTGAHGLQVRANMTLFGAASKMYDCVILPGGVGCYTMRGDEMLGKFLTEHARCDRLICAICAAPLILHDVGLLRGKKYIAHPGTYDELTDVSKGSDIIVDGNLITGSGPGAAAKFGFEILGQMTDKITADKVEKFMLF
jgi:4-methyl-5(b-hydroxyethyl)-thiazole monophosphate biosynthesis